MYVLQAVSATSALSNVSSSGSRGLTVAYGLQEVLRKPGMEVLLEKSKQAVVGQKEEIRIREEAQMKRDEERKRQSAERERLWREEVAPEEFVAALEKAEKSEGVYQLIGRNAYLMIEDGKYILYRPHTYYDGPSLSSGSGIQLKYGTQTLQPSGKNMHHITKHKTKESALDYYQNSEKEKSSYWMDISSISFAESKQERLLFARNALCKPVTKNGHDVRRVIDLFPHEVSNPRFIGSTRLYGMELKRDLESLYEGISKDTLREAFLLELFSQLREADGVTASSRSSIVSWFRQHRKMFGIES